MRIVKIISLLLLTVLALLCALIAFFLTTSAGLQFLAGQAKGFLPELTGGTFSGSVLSLEAKDVEWKQQGISFKGNFGWHLDIRRLLSGEVVVDRFYLQKASAAIQTDKIAAQETKEQSEEKQTAISRGISIEAPLPVHIESLSLSDIQIDINGQTLKVEDSKTALHWTDQGIDVPGISLNGTWQNFPLSVKGSVNTRDSGRLLHLSDIALNIGDNRFEVKGDVRFHAAVPNLDLSVRADASDFSEIVKDIKGRAKGRVQVRGPVLMPLINADLTVRDLVAQGTSINSLRLTGAMSAEENVTGGARLAVSGISLPGLLIDSFHADIEGTQNDHRLIVQINSKPAKLNATFSGALNDSMDAWAGSVKSFDVKTEYGPVTLRAPMSLAFNTNGLLLDVGRFCLSHPQAELCLKNDLVIDLLHKKPFDVELAFEKLDLTFFRHWLPEEFETTGVVNIRTALKVPQGFNSVPTGVVTMSGKSLFTRYRLQESDFEVGFDEVGVLLEHDGRKIHSSWDVQLTKNGSFAGELDVIDPIKQRGLDGAVRIKNLSASMFNSLLSPGESAEGIIYGDLQLGGTLSEPKLFGKTGIRDMRIDSTKLPFEMLPSSFELAFNGNKSTLSGELKTPKGGLTLQGDADWKTLAQGTTRLAAKGVKMRVTMPPSVEFDLTTDVHCEASAEKISLNGLIDLPWARVQMYELPPSATDVSADTVRLDRPRLKKADSGEPIPIESNLFVNIGDDVRVSAMGLRARMTGKLHVVQNNGKLGLTGQINVPQGQFKAYGQDLIVRRGEFMFAGAADNPLINLEAIRNPDKTADDVIAGIRVTGQADRPEVTIFTEPQKSQTESLSYLMRGEGLDPNGEGDNSMITSAIINLGLSQGNRVIEQLGDAVGISGLGLDTEGVGEDSAVAVSGYILPGLKVKYAVGLFDSLATLTLRYRVIPRLYVEAASGVDQALDVLYSFEF